MTRISLKQASSIKGVRDQLRSTVPGPVVRVVPSRDGVAILPAPPSVNEAYRNSSKAEIARGHRGRRKTDTYKAWIKSAGMMLNAARLGNFASPLSTVSIQIRVGKCNQARDLDNFAKAICDLLVSCGVIRSDNLTCVHSVSVVRAFGDVPEGMVAVSVSLIDAWEQVA